LGTVGEHHQAPTGRGVVWEVESVAAKSQHELVIAFKPTENSPIDLQVNWVCRPAAMSGRIEVQQPQLAIAIEGAGEVRFGQTTVFRIRVSNPGTGPAENVMVSLGAADGANQPNTLGTLAAGESRTLEVELTAKQAGEMRIQAVARADGDLEADAVHEVRVRRADLSVELTAPQLVYAESPAVYQIRIANRGDAPASKVTLQVNLPEGAKDAVGIDKKPLTSQQPRWQLGDLAAGAEHVLTMQCTLTSGGESRVVAHVQDAEGLTATETAVTVVEAVADLKLIVNDPRGPVPTGQDVVYEVQIVNRGSNEARGIELVAQFSDGIEPTSAKGHRSEIVPGQVIFEPIKAIPAGGQISVQITARAQRAGTAQFRAELTCGDPDTTLVSEESTLFFAATEANSGASRTAQRPATSEPTPAKR